MAQGDDVLDLYTTSPNHQNLGDSGLQQATRSADDEVLNEEIKACPAEILTSAYEAVLAEDDGAYMEAREAYKEELERSRKRKEMRDLAAKGLVNRRAPLNPFASHKLGKYRVQTPGTKDGQKVDDPALRNNPIYGKLLMCLSSNAILMFIFFQALLANKIQFGYFYASSSANKMVGPEGWTLLSLGALNANFIRNEKQWFRIFWAMWMHSGWLHIALNVLSQLQNLYMFEPDWGFWRCLFIYCVSGICGNLTSLVFNPCSTTVGSSGCLFGLMGAMVTYCIEFWETIPRPLCVMVFSLLVAILSLLMGFTSGTDNWAHMGGLLGGLASSLLTAPKFPRKVKLCGGSKKTDKQREEEEALEKAKRERRERRRVARTLTRWFPCLLWSWKIRETVVRICSLTFLAIYLSVTFTKFYNDYEYQPVGQPTFTSVNKCCCCYAPVQPDPTIYTTPAESAWQCYLCDSEWDDEGTTFGDWCSTAPAKSSTYGVQSELLNANNGSAFAALGIDDVTIPTVERRKVDLFGKPNKPLTTRLDAVPLEAIMSANDDVNKTRTVKQVKSPKKAFEQSVNNQDAELVVKFVQKVRSQEVF